MTEPTVPLKAAEILYVALSVAAQSSQVAQRTRENIRAITKAYERQRADALVAQGLKPSDAGRYTAAAAEALADWLDDRELRQAS